MAEIAVHNTQPTEDLLAVYTTETLRRSDLIQQLQPNMAKRLAEAALVHAKRQLDQSSRGDNLIETISHHDSLGLVVVATARYSSAKHARTALQIAQRWAKDAAQEHGPAMLQILDQHPERWRVQSHFRHTYAVVPHRVENRLAHRRPSNAEIASIHDAVQRHASALNLLEPACINSPPFVTLNSTEFESATDAIAEAARNTRKNWVFHDDLDARIAAGSAAAFAASAIQAATGIRHAGQRSAAVLAATGVALQRLTSAARSCAEPEIRQATTAAALAALDTIPATVEAEPNSLPNIRQGLLALA